MLIDSELQDLYDAAEILDGLFITSAANVVRLSRRVSAHACVNVALEMEYINDELTIPVLMWPLDDSPTQFIDPEGKLGSVVDWILKRIQKREKIIVFCHMGISRSATVCIACMMRYFKIDSKQALSLLKAKRTIVNPNSGFIKQLENFK